MPKPREAVPDDLTEFFSRGLRSRESDGRDILGGYLRDFSLERPDYVNLLASTIRWYLRHGSSTEFHKWQAIDTRFQLFAGVEAPTFCAGNFVWEKDVETGLKELGLHGTSIWGGLSAKILLRKVSQVGAFSIDDWTHYKFWFEKCADSFAHREHDWAQAIINAYKGKLATGDIRRSVSRYFVDRYGEPESDAAMWKQCSEAVRETVIQWLLFENLEKFFEVIADYAETTGGEMRSQWGYRKAFWLAIHRTGASL